MNVTCFCEKIVNPTAVKIENKEKTIIGITVRQFVTQKRKQ